MKRLGEHLIAVNWVNVVSVMLGMANLHYALKLVGFDYLTCAISHPDPVEPLILFIFMLVGVGMIFCFHFVFSFVSAALFFWQWFMHMSSPDNWLFELLFPAFFSLIVGTAQTLQCTQTSFLGYKLGNNSNIFPRWSFSILLALLLGYFNYLSKNGGEDIIKISITYSLCTLVLTRLTLYLEKYRLSFNACHQEQANRSLFRLSSMLIGLMLIFQVNADLHLNWFSTEGYKNLIATYQQTTNAPFFVKDFLKLSREYASILAPSQFIFESLAAICLFCGIIRLPMYLLTAGLLGLLMIVEFGVPAAWPPTASSSVNWLWELLLPTGVLIAAFLFEAGEVLSGNMSWSEMCFGNQRYQAIARQVKLEWIILLSSLCLILLLLNTSQQVANHTLIKTVMMALGLMAIQILFDSWRVRNETFAE